MAYGSFGELLGAAPSISASSNPYMPSYAGYAYDAESGKYQTKYRTLDPATGRWLSPDPIGFRGGSNLYSYVFNNPSLLIDPYGLAAGDAYSSMEAAAIDAAKDAFNATSRANIEYGGVIYFRSADGSYSYTPPMPGTADAFKIPLPLPAGTIALYHSHTPPDAEHGFPETASVEDRMASQTFNIPVYTATPGGNVMKYYDGKEVKIGVCKNAMP